MSRSTRIERLVPVQAAPPARRAAWRLADLVPILFILSLLFPYRVEAGALLLSPARGFLLLALLPCALAFLAGAGGRLRLADVLIFAHTAWASLALLLAHGPDDAAEPSGILFVEVMGSWLVARCFIRSAETFRAVVRVLFLSVVIMLPLMLAENFTGRHYLNELLSLFGPTITPHVMEPRMGMDRAFGVFDHPILLGVYCVGVFALSWYVLGYGAGRLARLVRTGLVAAGTATSLSSGPLLALVVQSIFMGWDYATRKLRRRWLVLGGLCAGAYAMVDLISNRTPFHVIVSYLSFNTGSAYNRILIWEFGSAEVIRHPLFGIGLSDWQRPIWMSGSMDNFWLVLAVQGGLPAFLFFAGAVFALCLAVGRLRLDDPRLIAYRRGWMIAILGLAVTGSTVHYWKTILCLLVFLTGSVVWMLDAGRQRGTAPLAVRPAAVKRPRPATIRFG